MLADLGRQLRAAVQRSQPQEGSRIDKAARVLTLAGENPTLTLQELADKVGMHVNTLSTPRWRTMIERARAAGRRNGGAAATSERPKAKGRRRFKPLDESADA